MLFLLDSAVFQHIRRKKLNRITKSAIPEATNRFVEAWNQGSEFFFEAATCRANIDCKMTADCYNLFNVVVV